MSKVTETEFNPEYFKAIFGDAPDDWQEFVLVNLRTFDEGLGRIRKAVGEGDMSVVSDVRHALGPAMKQWGTVSLEASMMALTADSLADEWPRIEPEFMALLDALKALN